MDFLPEAEFGRRLTAAVQRRIRELVAQGVPRRDAQQQAKKEFSVYDLIEIDHRGWVRFFGLDLSDADLKPAPRLTGRAGLHRSRQPSRRHHRPTRATKR